MKDVETIIIKRFALLPTKLFDDSYIWLRRYKVIVLFSNNNIFEIKERI